MDVRSISESVELSRYAALRGPLNQLDMLFTDARTMLRLPIPEDETLGAGLNFSAALVLLSAASGVSVCFMDPKTNSIRGKKTGDRTERLKSFLREYYCFRPDRGDYDPETAVEYLVYCYRNPLVHNLGYQRDNKAIYVLKASLSSEEIVDLHESAIALREPGLIKDPTIGPDGERVSLHVHMLYWGVVYATRKLLSIEERLEKADNVFRELEST